MNTKSNISFSLIERITQEFNLAEIHYLGFIVIDFPKQWSFNKVCYTSRCPCSLWTLPCFAGSSHRLCLMWFVFLGAELCLELPSDSSSQWTPLLSANGWRLHSPIVDFHHLVCYHAWHTKKGNPSLSFLL